MAYITEASAKIKEAFEIEKNGDADAAVVLLLEGCGDLTRGVKSDADSKRQRAVRLKVAQYVQKAETIERKLLDAHTKKIQEIHSKTDAAVAARAAAEQQSLLRRTNSPFVIPTPASREHLSVPSHPSNTTTLLTPNTQHPSMQPSFVPPMPDPITAAMPPSDTTMFQPTSVPPPQGQHPAGVSGQSDAVQSPGLPPGYAAAMTPSADVSSDVSPYPSLDLLRFDSPSPPLEGAPVTPSAPPPHDFPQPGEQSGHVVPPEGFFSPAIASGDQRPSPGHRTTHGHPPVTSPYNSAPAPSTSSRVTLSHGTPSAMSQARATPPPPPYSSLPGTNDSPIVFGSGPPPTPNGAARGNVGS